jgi:hypothetical protein
MTFEVLGSGRRKEGDFLRVLSLGRVRRWAAI